MFNSGFLGVAILLILFRTVVELLFVGNSKLFEPKERIRINRL